MKTRSQKNFIILSQALFLGWLLALPFYGPLLANLAGFDSYKGFNLVSIFLIFHIMTYLLASFLMKGTKNWYHLMLVSALVSLLANLSLILLFDFIWPLVMAVFGIAAAIYTLAWTAIYSTSNWHRERKRIIALVLIGGNLILLALCLAEKFLFREILFVVGLSPLLLTIALLIAYKRRPGEIVLLERANMPVPRKTLVFLFLFIFVIFVNGGFVYRGIMPYFAELGYQSVLYLPYLLYILVLTILYFWSDKVSKSNLVYTGLSFTGFAFIVFANFPHNYWTYFLTILLLEIAYAFLSVFLWITLNSLTHVFGRPFSFFGFILVAFFSGVFLGDTVFAYRLDSLADIKVVISMLSLTSILLVILFTPYLLKLIKASINLALENSTKEEETSQELDSLFTCLEPRIELTDRESEVLELALLGLTNKEIGDNLYISENTIKSHLRKVYKKFGISGKQELIYLANRERLIATKPPGD